jgi:hypothetical protein
LTTAEGINGPATDVLHVMAHGVPKGVVALFRPLMADEVTFREVFDGNDGV